MPRPTGPVLGSAQWGHLLPGHFGKRQSDAETAYQNALADLAYKQGTLFQKYGVRGNIGEGGATTFDIDASAGHGVFQDMFRTQAGELTGAEGAAKRRGFKTGGGIGGRQASLLKFMQGGQRANVLQELLGAAQGIFSGKQSALGIRNTEWNTAEGDAYDYLERGGFFKDPEAPAPAPPAPEPTAAPPYDPGQGGPGAPPGMPLAPWGPDYQTPLRPSFAAPRPPAAPRKPKGRPW